MTEFPAGADELYDEAAVAEAMDGMAARLEAGLAEGPVCLWAVMNGGMYPAVDLSRRLQRPLTLDYVHASRYRGATSGGQVQWLHWPEALPVEGTVILVDDIFDEGHTLAAIRERLATATSARVITAVLARKRHRRGLDRGWVDLHALEVPDRYVFGCGMDYQEHWRHLKGIWALPESDHREGPANR